MSTTANDPPELACEAPEVTWRDGKRYAWLLGLVVPLAPFIAWGLASATGLGLFW